MQDESSRGASPPLSDDELLDRGYYRIEELILVRSRAERIGLTLYVRSADRENRDEPYVYVLEGEGQAGEPVAYSTLEQVERRLTVHEVSHGKRQRAPEEDH